MRSVSLQPAKKLIQSTQVMLPRKLTKGFAYQEKDNQAFGDNKAPCMVQTIMCHC